MVFANISHCTKPNGAVSLKERVTEAVPFASCGDTCVLPEVNGVALSDSSATSYTEVTPKPSFTPDQVIVTTTILVMVEVLSVQVMVALAFPSYAAACGAKAGARSMAVPRDTTTSRSKASRSGRFIAIPPSVLNVNNQGFPDKALSEDTQHSYRTLYFSGRSATFRPDFPGVTLLLVTSFVALGQQVIVSSVVAKSEARRRLIIAHGIDKLGSSGMERP